MTTLADKKCLPCEGGDIPILTESQRAELLTQIDNWSILPSNELKRVFDTGNFVQGVKFITALTPIAEEEGHHPDIMLSYPKVEVAISTHSVGNITEADFVLAAKLDRVWNNL